MLHWTSFQALRDSSHAVSVKLKYEKIFRYWTFLQSRPSFSFIKRILQNGDEVYELCRCRNFEGFISETRSKKNPLPLFTIQANMLIYTSLHFAFDVQRIHSGSLNNKIYCFDYFTSMQYHVITSLFNNYRGYQNQKCLLIRFIDNRKIIILPIKIPS